MRKIEFLTGKVKDCEKNMLTKINEIVNAVNALYSQLNDPQPTQEPERTEDQCKVCGKICPDGQYKIRLYPKSQGNEHITYCSPDCSWKDDRKKVNWVEEKPAKKEMPCGHKLSDVSTGDEGTSYCRKCEEEAKKECRLSSGNELLDLMKWTLEDRGTIDIEVIAKELADEARKWACEVVEKAFRDSNENYEGVLLDEVLERLNGRETYRFENGKEFKEKNNG